MSKKNKQKDPVESNETVINVPMEYYEAFRVSYERFDEYTVKLFRRERKINGKSKKTFLKRYFDEIPWEENIIEEFGVGDFSLFSMDPESGEPHWVDMDIDPSLAHLHKPRINGTEVHPGPYHPLPPPPDPMKYMKDMMESVVTPMLNLVQSSQNQPAQPDNQIGFINNMVNGMMDTLTTGLGKMQTTMINQQIENVKKITTFEKEPPVVQEDSMMKDVLGIIKEFGSRFIEAKGPTSDIYKNAITTNPQFKQLLQNSDDLSTVYSAGAYDPEIGKKKMDDLFAKLNIETPSDDEFAAQQASAAQ